MSIGAVFVLLGAAIAALAGIGLLKFSTTYSRIHAAGKASPVAFLFVAVGAWFEIGADGALRLLVAAAALILTLPVAVHLLFRAVHRSGTGGSLGVDELAERSPTVRTRRSSPT